MKKIIGLGIIGFILVVGSINAGATSTVPSDGVLYSDSGKTVKEALDELFTELGDLKKIGTASEADILQDKTALVQGIEIKGQMANNGYGSVIPLDRVILWDNYVYYRIPGGYYPINSTIGYSAVKATYSDVASKVGLTADKLAKGQSVLGVSGTYTSDATASAANILSGKTAYINGSKTTGTMADYTGTPQQINSVRLANNRFEVAVARGYHDYSWAGNSYEYLTYTQVANTIGLTAAKLAKGQTVLGIQGSYVCASDTTATAADIASGKTAYINGSKVTGTNTSTYKVYNLSSTQATVSGAANTFVYGTWKDVVSAGTTVSFSVNLGVTPSEVVSCDLKLKGNYTSDSESDSDEDFRINRGYQLNNGAAKYYWYFEPLTTSKDKQYMYTNTSYTNYSGISTNCTVSGSTAMVQVGNIAEGTGTGTPLQTRADTFYISGTIVYK